MELRQYPLPKELLGEQHSTYHAHPIGLQDAGKSLAKTTDDDVLSSTQENGSGSWPLEERTGWQH